MPVIGVKDRRSQRQPIGTEFAQGFDQKVLALHVVDTPQAIEYGTSQFSLGPFSSSPGSDPNVTPPTTDQIYSSSDKGYVSLYPVWSGTKQACVFAVWCPTGIPTAGMGWVKVGTVSFKGDGTDVETIVAVGGRECYIQAVSGVDVGHPVTVLVGCA